MDYSEVNLSSKVKADIFLLEGVGAITKHSSFDKLVDMFLSKYGVTADYNVWSSGSKIFISNSRQADNVSGSGKYTDKTHISCEISLLHDGDNVYLVAKAFKGTCFLMQDSQGKDSCSVNGALYIFNDKALEVNRVTYDVSGISGIFDPKGAMDNYRVEFPVITIARGGGCSISNLVHSNQHLNSGVDVELMSISRRKPVTNGYSNYDFFADIYHNKLERGVNGMVQHTSNSEFVYCNPVNDPSSLESLIVIGTKDGVPQPGCEKYDLVGDNKQYRTESGIINYLCNNILPKCSASLVMPYTDGKGRK